MVHPGEEERKQVPVAEVKPDSYSGNRSSRTTAQNDDVVTLTKSQLRAIFEAIGQVGNLSISDKPISSERHSDETTGKKKTDITSSDKVSATTEVNGSSDSSNCQAACPVDVLLSSPSKVSSSEPPQKQSQLQSNMSSQLPESPAKSNLSRLEQKRIQWEKEKAEMHEWNPWGKPGAGAPTRKSVPIASVAPRTDSQNEEETYNEEISNKKQQWLKELENQREEQRLQRMLDQDQFNPHACEADWSSPNRNDLDSISISFDGTNNVPCSAAPLDGRSFARGQGFKLDPDSAAIAEEKRHKAQEYQTAIRMQMEEKQRRLQEEKERKKVEEEEEERRLAAERAQMQAEYEQEQKRLKQKMEMEEKKQNAMLTAVREAQAQAEACKKSKKAQKLQQAQANVDVDGNNSKTTSLSPRKPCVLNSPRSQHKGEEAKKWNENVSGSSKPHQALHPLQSASPVDEPHQKSPVASEMLYSKEIGIQTIPLSALHSEEYSGYTTNRVITPASYRIRNRRSHAKDFGTQTDINYGKYIGDDAESTDQSNTSSFRPPVNKRLTRVQHSKPYKASRHQFGSEMSSLTDRPKWGANQPNKSFVRMTDRDPHFTKRKKLQELRKQHWEREMATQQVLRNARHNNPPSYPTLRSRRIRSSSEGTAGFSSSDFEAVAAVRRMPRRYKEGNEYCSMCGSAEEIDYLRNSPTYSSSRLPSMRQRRDSQSSDNLPSIIGGSEPTPSRLTERFSFPEVSVTSSTTLPPMRRKWHSQEMFCPHGSSVTVREPSPPVPALHKRLLSGQTSSSLLSPPTVHSRRKWSDQESFDLESVTLSRARRSASEDSSEKNEKESLSSAGSSKRGKTPTEQNPLVCPEVVTGRPTPRQDRILQNLSSLRQGLLQKQKEIETLLCQPSVS